MDAETRAWYESAEALRAPEESRLQVAAIAEHRTHWDRIGECPFCLSRPFLDQHDIAKHVEAWKKRQPAPKPESAPTPAAEDAPAGGEAEQDVPDVFDEVAKRALSYLANIFRQSDRDWLAALLRERFGDAIKALEEIQVATVETAAEARCAAALSRLRAPASRPSAAEGGET